MITMKTLTIQPLLFVAIDRGDHNGRSQPAYQNQAYVCTLEGLIVWYCKVREYLPFDYLDVGTGHLSPMNECLANHYKGKVPLKMT